jgi:hypothetical protein
VDLGENGWGCGVNSTGLEYGPVSGFCECVDEHSISRATDLVMLPSS